MEGIKRRFSIIRVALGSRRYLLAPVFGSIAGFFSWLADEFNKAGMNALVGFPPWAVATIVMLLMIAWWLLEYAEKLQTQISGTRAHLSALLSKGVEIRNDGRGKFPDQDSWIAWEESAVNWNSEVIEAIRKVNEADAQWFAVLDVVPSPRLKFDPTHIAHTKLYREHDFRLKRLGDMVQNLRRD